MNKKRSFIRTLWGIYDTQGRRFWQRRKKMDKDIELIIKNPIQVPFICYTFGEDNHKYLIDLGFNSRMVDKNPVVFDMDTQQFRHKLEAFKVGMEEFDEIAFLDWDTVPVMQVPENIWELQYEKKPFQALLRAYKQRRAMWRETYIDQRSVPCASYVYIREKQITLDLIKTWEALGKPMSEEVTIAKYIDDVEGGWKGFQYWWDNYETMFFHLSEGRIFGRRDISKKTKVFEHFNCDAVELRLKQLSELK